MQKNNKFYILHPFGKSQKIVVSNCWQNFLRYCQYVGKEAKRYRHIFKKWHVYKVPASVFNYNPTIYDFYLPKKITIVDLFQINDIIISFKGVINKINDLLKPSTDIWNNNKKITIWKDQLGLPQQMFVELALGNYLKKLLVDFITESHFLYNKSNLIEESFITEIDKLISIYGSISYFGKKRDEIAEIVSSSNPLEFNVKKIIP